MMLDAPLAHVIQNGVWMMDDQVYPIAELENVQINGNWYYHNDIYNFIMFARLKYLQSKLR